MQDVIVAENSEEDSTVQYLAGDSLNPTCCWQPPSSHRNGRTSSLQKSVNPRRMEEAAYVSRFTVTSIGFTGTRQGMTEGQKGALHDLLASYTGTIFHHGDAVGADAEAHDIAAALGCTIVIHPPANETQRAFKTAGEIRAPRAYLDRNRDIVRETTLLIAVPAETTEQSRSGTWSTVRYARRLHRAVCVILPSGEVEKMMPVDSAPGWPLPELWHLSSLRLSFHKAGTEGSRHLR